MLTIQGSFVGTLKELNQLITLAKQDAIPHIPIIDADLSAESVGESLDKLTHGGVPGRVVLRAAVGA
jgi:alcohol dehydrogenase/propanol-preferring alcohol dehydrogenase